MTKFNNVELDLQVLGSELKRNILKNLDVLILKDIEEKKQWEIFC